MDYAFYVGCAVVLKHATAMLKCALSDITTRASTDTTAEPSCRLDGLSRMFGLEREIGNAQWKKNAEGACLTFAPSSFAA